MPFKEIDAVQVKFFDSNYFLSKIAGVPIVLYRYLLRGWVPIPISSITIIKVLSSSK